MPDGAPQPKERVQIIGGLHRGTTGTVVPHERQFFGMALVQFDAESAGEVGAYVSPADLRAIRGKS